MRRTRAAALFALVPLTTLLVAAESDGTCQLRELEYKDEIVEYEVCEQQVWFTDERPGLGNLAETGLVPRPTWSTEPPAGSYQSGNGYGSLGNPLPYIADTNNEAGSAVFEGTFTGPVDTMTVTIHGTHFGYGGTSNPSSRQAVSINFKVFIDDQPVLPAALVEDTPFEPAPNATGLEQYQFTFSNLIKGMLRAGIDLDPTAEHTVRFSMAPNYVNTGLYAFWVYGATEVDGGIVFNDLDLPEDAFTIRA